MPKDPVCGNEINEEDARSSTGQTMFGASEVDPQQGTRSFMMEPGITFAVWIVGLNSWRVQIPTCPKMNRDLILNF